MIIKFDGVDGCGKSTLSRAVAKYLSSRRHTVAVMREFSSPAKYSAGSSKPLPVASMRIRETVLDPTFDCDDVERQLLLHFLSRRKNRVEIPYLHKLNDFVVVDRSTLSNYAYAAAIDPELAHLSEVATDDVEKADLIFWIDTPVDVCMTRVLDRSLDAVEQKGRIYFERVRELFQGRANARATVHVLDGSMDIQRLVEQVVSIIDRRRDVGS